jgi:hypothetical protein
MYLTGKILIDPSQITIYKKVKPTKLFAKFVDILTFGSLSQKREHETFTAVAILQQMNIALRSINIKNVIRLAVDDYDFYIDEKGEEDDLEQAMFQFKAKVDPIESEFFNTIYLVLEHIENSIKYLIEIAIYRKHKIGEYPIKININGVCTEFKLNENENVEQLKALLESIFASQETYDKFIKNQKQVFNQFIDNLEIAIKRFVKIDDIKKDVTVQVIRPIETITSKEQMRHARYANPAFYGYYAFDEFFFYSWLWSDMMFTHNIYCNDCYLVDTLGNNIMKVGLMGFNAGATKTLITDSAFEPPAGGDITYFGYNDFAGSLVSAKLIEQETRSDETGSANEWLAGDEYYDEGEGSCNSCSSCGSCSND